MYHRHRIAFVLFTLLAAAAPSFAQGILTITIEPGEHYTHTRRFMLVKKVTLTPQMAFWLADGDGNHVADIAVTYRSAQDDWRGLGDVDRPEALPVWSHARGVQAEDGGMMPEGETVLPDAVTMATPESDFTIEWPVDSSIEPGVYVVMAEANTSYDYQEPWKDDLPEDSYYYNGVNGQPSVVWRGAVDIGGGAATIELEPFGHGSPTGADGDIVKDLGDVAGAAGILERIAVTYAP